MTENVNRKSEMTKCQIWLDPTSTHPLFNHPNIKTKLSSLNINQFKGKYLNFEIPQGATVYRPAKVKSSP